MLQIGVFVAASLGALTILKIVSMYWQPGRSHIRRRLAGEFAEPVGGGPGPLYRDVEKWDLAEAELDAAAPVTKAKPGFRERAEEALRHAGLNLTVRKFMVMIAAAIAIGCGVGTLVGGWFAVLAGSIAGLILPFLFVNLRQAIRRERYVRQLVSAFELMARVLRAGQSVPESLRSAQEAHEEPLRGEFGRCLHEIEHGIRPQIAFQELSDRSGVLELRIFVIAMAIQRQSGGNLSEVLDRLATVARTRMRLRQKMRALTAEGRLQSLTLTLLPLAVFGAMYFINRQYAEELLKHPQLLLATAGCMTIGVLWIRSIMKFEG